MTETGDPRIQVLPVSTQGRRFVPLVIEGKEEFWQIQFLPPQHYSRTFIQLKLFLEVLKTKKKTIGDLLFPLCWTFLLPIYKFLHCYARHHF